MTDVAKLYEVIHDAIDEIGEYSYIEILGVLEIIKAEVLKDYLAELENIRNPDKDESE